ncbi:MAG: DUF3006 domain-containing protein [Acutalibacteraceae bacterium]
MNDIYIIDRFEGDFAVVEHGDEMLNIKRSQLPENAKVGDVLIRCEERFVVDSVLTAARRSEIQRLQDELFR